MTTVRPSRRPWTAVTALTAAALLALSACGTDGEEAPEPDPAPIEETGASDGGGDQDADGSDDGGEEAAPPEDPDDDQEPGDGEAPEDEAPEGDGTVRMKFAPDLGELATEDQGVPTLGAEELGTLLGENLPEDADCAGELLLEEGETQECQAPDSIEGGEMTTWTAHPVRVPAEDGLDQDSRHAVLFTSGGQLPPSAQQILDEDVSLTGAGIGSAFGMEEVPAGQLSQSVLSMLTGDYAYVPVNQALPDGSTWEDVTCEDPLSFETFEAADCTATTSEGDQWPLVVVPGSYIDNDQGLLIGIGASEDG